jgi:hypothetical protein
MRGWRWRRAALMTVVAAIVPTAAALVPTPAAADAPGDQVALVEPSGRWHFQTGGIVDYTFWYGIPGDVPLLGDWDGDGLDSPGMYRPSSGFAYLTNDLPPDRGVGVADPELTFFFGIPGDQVFVGDWNGDGRDSLGISRGGHIYLSNTNATVFADVDFWFGAATDVAFGGDPDADGDDNLFLYRAATGFVYYRAANSTGVAEGGAYSGEPTDRFVIGDWDGDGVDTVGLFRPSARTIYLRNSLEAGPADVSFMWGQSDWVPVSGFSELGAG